MQEIEKQEAEHLHYKYSRPFVINDDSSCIQSGDASLSGRRGKALTIASSPFPFLCLPSPALL